MKRRDLQRQRRRLAKRVARANDTLAARLVELRHLEEAHEAPVALDGARGKKLSRALLIINTKSGPNNDSILRVKEIVQRLAAHGIKADVRVKLRKKYARKDARRAAKQGYPLVIAAGGDGTIAPVAEGLIGTDAVLGIIPLGTYNNVATSLGVPTELEAAIALIASGLVRAVDVGLVTAAGANRPRTFLEMALVGVSAAMMPVGQDVKAGKWRRLSTVLPAAIQMTPTSTEVRLDKVTPAREALTLLVEIANAPRSGPGMITSPAARLDDGQLQVAIYDEHTQASLAARFVALKMGMAADDAGIERASARRVDVRSANALPVVADAKLIGHTPARFEVLTGCLLVAAGLGIGLEQKPHPDVVAAATVPAPVHEEERDAAEARAIALATPAVAPAKNGPLAIAADAIGKARDTIDNLRGARDA